MIVFKDDDFEIDPRDQIRMNRKARRNAQIQRGFNRDRKTVEMPHKSKVPYNRKEKHKKFDIFEDED